MKLELVADTVARIFNKIEEGSTMNYAYDNDQPPHPVMPEEEDKVKVMDECGILYAMDGTDLKSDSMSGEWEVVV